MKNVSSKLARFFVESYICIAKYATLKMVTDKIPSLLRSMRLRTLPLSLSGVVLGFMLASNEHQVPWYVILLTLLTTVCLQILSNLSNELGDYLQGTDGEGRVGPSYSLSSGLLTVKDFRICILLFVGACCLFGLLMTWTSFGTLFALQPILILALGACAIWAAMHYTLGKRPYGYRGLGDLFVFIFFGLVPVIGGYYVAVHTFPPLTVWLPAVAIGCFSVGVLNVNNIRDMQSDAGTRVTLPLLMGERRAKCYHTFLIVTGWLAMIAFALLNRLPLVVWLFLLTLPLYILHLCGIWKHSGKTLDPLLPMLVMSTFALSLLTGIGWLLAS